jgi:hypothetical protein
MVTFDPADYSASKVLHIHDRGHELFIGISHQQICGRYGSVVLVPQRVDELVDGAGLFDLGELIAVLAEQRHGLAVKVHLDIRESAFACRVELVRPIEYQ